MQQVEVLGKREEKPLNFLVFFICYFTVGRKVNLFYKVKIKINKFNMDKR